MQVEDFSDLSKVSTEKLLKLRDVANDNLIEAQNEAVKAHKRLVDIRTELGARKNAEKAV